MRLQSGVGQGCGLTWELAWARGPFSSDTLHGLAAASKARYPREKGSSHEGLYPARSHTYASATFFSYTDLPDSPGQEMQKGRIQASRIMATLEAAISLLQH